MVYPTRTATTGAAIDITFTKLIDYPAFVENEFSADTPAFLAGSSVTGPSAPNAITSNMPALLSTAYDSDFPPPGHFTGIHVYGVSHGDYAVREAGTIDHNTQGSEYFEEQGYIDGAFFGLDQQLQNGTNPGSYDEIGTYYFGRQQMGAFTGGGASPISISGEESQDITWEDELSGIQLHFIGASIDSTTSDPAALFIGDVNYWTGSAETDGNIVGLRMGLTGSITRKGLFTITPANGLYIRAQCRDDTNHYFVFEQGQDGTPANLGCYTQCTESIWGTFSYTNYTAKFSDPDLPGSLGELLTDDDPNYKYRTIYGTDNGFLISYAKYNGAVWVPKFVLVDKAWTTVQHINAIAGDATATTILAQGAGNADANAISIMAQGNYAWMIGGTPEAPLIVEGASGIESGSDGDGDGLQDTSVRLRVWGYNLDGHKHVVWRIGPSATLVYDPTTNTWAEWASPGRDNWRAHVGQNWIGMSVNTLANGFGSDVVAGDDASGVLWILDPTTGRDDRSTTGDDAFNRRVIGGLTLSGREVVPCGALQLDYSGGNPTQSGATFTLEISDDWGNTFDSQGSVTVTADDFAGTVEWRGLGLAKYPGRVFRITDNGAAVRISGAELR